MLFSSASPSAVVTNRATVTRPPEPPAPLRSNSRARARARLNGSAAQQTCRRAEGIGRPPAAGQERTRRHLHNPEAARSCAKAARGPLTSISPARNTAPLRQSQGAAWTTARPPTGSGSGSKGARLYARRYTGTSRTRSGPPTRRASPMPDGQTSRGQRPRAPQEVGRYANLPPPAWETPRPPRPPTTPRAQKRLGVCPIPPPN